MEKKNWKKFWIRLISMILVGLMSAGSVCLVIALIINMW